MGFWVMVLPLLVFAADTPLLERIITVSFQQQRMDVVLKKISEQGDFTFSYNAAIIDGSRIVTQNFTRKTVREVLDQLFGGTIQYKARGKYIILTRAPTSSLNKDERLLSGYVVDEATGERLKNVSIYDPVTLTSTITDAYGYFEIKIDKPPADVKLSVAKLDYTDTLVVVPSEKSGLLNIPIHINKGKIKTVADSVGRKISRFWRTKIMKPQEVNMANIHDTLYRTTQVSFVPFVGTNRKLSGNVINDYSFNILGGYALGTQKLEIGSIFNVDRGNVNGIQFAGLFNTVGGRVKGVQLAGLFNANGDSLDGTQLAGLINVNLKGSKKFSGAGLINFTRLDSRAVQFAGLFNATIGAQRGPQVAGLFNFSTGSVTPLQWAGLWNFSAGNMKGAQVAGLWNFAGGEVTGGQVSGLLNYATRMKGAQVGLINISDSIRGVPVGFFSFSLKGYHKLEISADEIFYTNVAFRTGVRQFYNIFTAGAKPNTFENDTTFWTFGYGIGTAPRINKWLSLNFDLTANQLVHRAEIEEINLLNKLHVGCDVRLIKRVSLTFGVTLNAYITDTTYDGYIDIFTDYRPSIIYDHTYSNNVNMKMWWGGKVGLRFF